MAYANGKQFRHRKRQQSSSLQTREHHSWNQPNSRDDGAHMRHFLNDHDEQIPIPLSMPICCGHQQNSSIEMAINRNATCWYTLGYWVYKYGRTREVRLLGSPLFGAQEKKTALLQSMEYAFVLTLFTFSILLHADWAACKVWLCNLCRISGFGRPIAFVVVMIEMWAS